MLFENIYGLHLEFSYINEPYPQRSLQRMHVEYEHY
jgi:hypothetical protein